MHCRPRNGCLCRPSRHCPPLTFSWTFVCCAHRPLLFPSCRPCPVEPLSHRMDVPPAERSRHDAQRQATQSETAGPRAEQGADTEATRPELDEPNSACSAVPCSAEAARQHDACHRAQTQPTGCGACFSSSGAKTRSATTGPLWLVDARGRQPCDLTARMWRSVVPAFPLSVRCEA